MAEFAKKGVMGYKVLPGGRNDSESTHAILSLEEYDELLRRIAVAERDKHEAIAQAKRTIGREQAARRAAGQGGRRGRAGTGDGHGGEADQG